MRLFVCCLLASILLLGMAPSVVDADVEATDADLAAAEAALDRGELVRARKLYRAPAEDGDRKAQFLLGRLLLHEAQIEGLRWIRTSAEAGHLPAEVHLASFHVRGLYVPRDLATSVTWFARAVRHRPEEEARHRAGAAEARYYLYQAHWNGYGGARVDKEAALTYLKESADAGHRAAQADLARVFESGSAGEVDFVEAHKYHVLAWKQGSDDGERNGKAGAIALRKRMTEAQFQQSRARIREWFDARKAGRLGWVFDAETQRSKGLARLEGDEYGEAATVMFFRFYARSASCTTWWVRYRELVRGSPGRGRWVERWVLDWCGRTRSYPITLTRRGEKAWGIDVGKFTEIQGGV